MGDGNVAVRENGYGFAWAMSMGEYLHEWPLVGH